MAPRNAAPDLQCVEHAPEFLLNPFSHRLHGRIADDLLHHSRIENRNMDCRILFIHNHVAGEEQADLLFCLNRLMGEMGITGSEDRILWNVSTGLYFYRLEAVDVVNPNNRFVQVKKMMLLK